MEIINNGEYYRAKAPDHPHANKHGYVLAHRLVMEEKLGRLLKENELVHHLDGNTKNNNPDNLVVVSTIEHMKLHGMYHNKTMVKMVCAYCGGEFERELRNVSTKIKNGQTNFFCSRVCMGHGPKHADFV